MSKKSLILLLAIILLIPNFTYAVTTAGIQSQETDPDLHFFIDTFQYIKDTYPFEVENKLLIEGALKGMLQILDPYSDYYTAEEAEEIYKSMLGVFSGIGVYIEEKDSYINIYETIKDSPGEKAGLKKGDLIISIDDMHIKNISLNDAKNLIQGPKDTIVKLEIKRASKLKSFYVEVKRDTITINPVSYEIINNDIGYINLSEFSQSATSEMYIALAKLEHKGISKIILDLRNNPGGLLSQVIDISRAFIPSGPIVHIKERNKELLTHISTTQKPKYDLVVLVNEYSASASEILAGAVKDTKAGTIIGKQTFGKGIVQSMIPLANGSMIKMTTAEYLTPNKNSIHGVGVVPDILVDEIEGEDAPLREAVKILK